jgi:hypothetical protein
MIALGFPLAVTKTRPALPTAAKARPGLAENSREAIHFVFMDLVSCKCRARQVALDLGADTNAALNILAAGLAVSARGGSVVTPAREPRTHPRDRPLYAGSTGIPVKMTFVI